MPVYMEISHLLDLRYMLNATGLVIFATAPSYSLIYSGCNLRGGELRNLEESARKKEFHILFLLFTFPSSLCFNILKHRSFHCYTYLGA